MAVVQGFTETGVSTMKMDRGLDTGDILLKQLLVIGPNMSAGELHEKLMHLSAEVLAETLDAIDLIIPEKQNGALATYAPIITKEMAHIDWTESSQEIHNLIRGFNPWPVAYTDLGDKRIKVYQSEVVDEVSTQFNPGHIVSLSSEGMIVQTGRGTINLLEIQLPGKKRISSAAFAVGHKLPDDAFLK
jgi:methionyl-tRNA formyltransferase